MSRRVVAIVVACLAIGLAGAGAYALGASSVPHGDELAAAKGRSGATSFEAALRDGIAAGRERGRQVGAIAGTAIATARGGQTGARVGSAAAKEEKQRAQSGPIAASVTTRKEAEGGTTADLAGTGDVLVVGDSLEVGSSPYIGQYLSDAKLTVNAEVGASSPEIFGFFQESYDPSQSVIVFDAGTNDAAATPEILQTQLEAVANIAAGRCLVVPTVHVGDEDRTEMNRVIRNFAASHPGTQVPDWARFAATHPELISGDGVHPTGAGYQQRGQLIAEGIRACLGAI